MTVLTIELTGKELGDFPDTPVGKKALRTAAKIYLHEMVGVWIPCPALAGEVEIRRSGARKIISLSGDTRKLKLVPAIANIIQTSEKLATTLPYDGEADKSARAYHILHAEVSLEGTAVIVRTVIKEDVAGKFHYDMSVVETKRAGTNPSSPV
jgi:hypothetical protein